MELGVGKALLGLPSSVSTRPVVTDPLGRWQRWSLRHFDDEQKKSLLRASQLHDEIFKEEDLRERHLPPLLEASASLSLFKMFVTAGISGSFSSALRAGACCGQTAGVATPSDTLFGAEAEVNSGRTSR